MSLRRRMLAIMSAIAVVLLLANAQAIVCWVEAAGAIDWAQYVRAEYLTGTAIVVILAMVFLMGGSDRPQYSPWRSRRCRVCDQPIVIPGRYCGACGSRV